MLHAVVDVGLVLGDGLRVVLLLVSQLLQRRIEPCKLLLALAAIDALVANVLLGENEIRTSQLRWGQMIKLRAQALKCAHLSDSVEEVLVVVRLCA